ncbi:MAG: PAS domain S-box protein [bacterium]
MREKILIAESNPRFLGKLSTILIQNNYQIIAASKQDELLEHVQKDSPDLLLWSYSIPFLDDPGLLKSLHQNHENTSIVFLVNQENESRIRDLICDGADDYLVEPFDDSQVLAVVGNALKFRQIKLRNKMICQELVNANQRLSIKTRQFQELVDFHNSILENINVGIFTIDSRFAVTSWNKKIQELTGISRENALEKNIFSLFPVLREDNLHQRISQVVHHGGTTELGHIYSLNPLGEHVCCAYKISPIRKNGEILGAVLLVDDITQKINLQQELNKTQRYLSHLVENSTDAIISFDLDGVIVTWNQGAEAIYGYSDKEAIGRKWDILVPAHHHDEVGHLFKCVKENSSVKNLELSMINRKGKEIPVTMSLSLIKDPHGHIFGLSCISRDQSEKRDLQNQLIHTQKMASLGSMAAGMAHDINNPLASILAYAELLVNKTEKIGFTELTGHLLQVEEDVERIGSMIRKMLWYSKPSPPQLSQANVNEQLNRAVEFANFQTPLRDIKVVREYDPNLPDTLMNTREIVQAFVNLITNAVKAMPNNQGTLTLKTFQRHNMTNGADEIVIMVSDTGIGIPEENLGKIFQYCFTTGESTGKGNGLGLYVVRAIVEENGGNIQVQSKVNEGTTFTITLPIKTDGKSNPFLQ